MYYDKGHIIYIGNKIYLAEEFIIQTERKMDIIKDSINQVVRIIEARKRDLRVMDSMSMADIPSDLRADLSADALIYYINKIKEEINDDT